MKNRFFAFSLTALFCACGIVEMAPRRVEGFDATKSEYHADGYSLHPINAKYLYESCKPGDTVYIWAPWCPHCIVALDKIQDRKSFKLVSASYDIEGIAKVFKKRPHLKLRQLKVIDALEYGKTESDRIASFCDALGYPSAHGLPQVFVLNENGEFIKSSLD